MPKWMKWRLGALLLVVVLISAQAIRYGNQRVHTDARRTVWINALGPCYHTEGCDYLTYQAEPVMLGDALVKRFKPCPECKPGGMGITRFEKLWGIIWRDKQVTLSWVGVFLSFVLIGITYTYVRHTKGMVGQMQGQRLEMAYQRDEMERQRLEMQKQRLNACMPVLHADWCIQQEFKTEPGEHPVQVVTNTERLVVVNQGPGTALHVDGGISFARPGHAKQMGRLLYDKYVPISICALSPGGQYDTYVPSSFAGSEPIKITMKYQDIHGREFSSEVVLQKQYPIRFKFIAPSKAS